MGNVFAIEIWVLLSIESLVYLTSGVLIYFRSSKRAIRVRSPKLLQISHWCNFIEVIIVLIGLNFYQGYQDSYNFILILCTVTHFLIHYLFFIPFILRSYRLYSIFSIDRILDIKDKSFLTKIKKTREKYLIRMLFYISTPFAITCIVVYSIDSRYNFLEYQNEHVGNHQIQLIVNSISLMITFTEQMISVFAINSIRNIKDDFRMSYELCFINIVWVLTSTNLVLNSYSYFAYQVLLRNNLILFVSSLFPLLKTFKKENFEVPLTEEALKSLALILQHKLTFEAFEDFLKQSQVQYQYHSGLSYLNLWLECELCKLSPLRNNTHINTSAASLSILQTSTPDIQSEVFQVLNSCFYPIFLNSPQYMSCLKEVNRQKLYLIHIELSRENYRITNVFI